MDVRLKRAYELPAPSDGYRVLTDRIWPRGVSREDAHNDAVVLAEILRRGRRSR